MPGHYELNLRNACDHDRHKGSGQERLLVRVLLLWIRCDPRHVLSTSALKEDPAESIRSSATRLRTDDAKAVSVLVCTELSTLQHIWSFDRLILDYSTDDCMGVVVLPLLSSICPKDHLVGDRHRIWRCLQPCTSAAYHNK